MESGLTSQLHFDNSDFYNVIIHKSLSQKQYIVILQMKFMYKSGAENKNKPYFYDLP